MSNFSQQKSYQAQHHGPHLYEPVGPNAPKWYFVDAQNKVVGRLASVIAKVISGKHKPSYTAHADQGDFVVVLNAEKIALTRTKWDKKLYRDYSGWISGLKTKTARELHQKHPEEIIRRAVWGMLNKTSLSRHQIKKLKIYASTEHPHSAQNPLPLPEGVTRRSVLRA